MYKIISPFWISFILLLCTYSVLARVSTNTGHYDNSIIAVKQRTIDFLMGSTQSGKYMDAEMEHLDLWVEQNLAEKPVELDWNTENWSVFNEILVHKASEIRKLTIAYGNKRSRFYHDQNLQKEIINGLEEILTFFNPETERPGNWYYWLIPLPRELGMIGLLAEEFLPGPIYSELIRSLRFELSTNMILTGANAVWEAKNHFYLALMEEDEERLEKSVVHAFSQIRLGLRTGIREDYCYLFHGLIPYGATYGAGYVETVSDFIYYLEDSPWAAPSVQREMIVNLLLEHTRWFISGDMIDLHIMGRVYEQGHRGWTEILKSLLIMSQTQSPRKDELEMTAKAMLDKKATLSFEVAHIGDEISGQKSKLPMGFRYWASGEIGAYNQPDYHVGFRQYSNRVLDYEYLTGLGAEGWNLAFGFTNILRTDGSGSWYDDEGKLLEDIDMEHLPGTTSRIGGNPVNPPYTDPAFGTPGFSLNRGTSPFAGGAGWENGGVAGFHLVPKYGGFEANKSLHFFDKGFWALGSDIISTSDSMEIENKPIHTTALQWVCSKEEPVIFVNDKKLEKIQDGTLSLTDVRWVWFEQVGLIFLQPQEIVIRKKEKIVTIWIDHGVAPDQIKYAYAVLPYVSQEVARSFAAERSVNPVRFDSKVHAVADRDRQTRGIVYFDADTCLELNAEAPAVVYRNGNTREGILTVQDPLHSGKNLRFSTRMTQEITRPDPDVRVTTVDTDNAMIDVAAFKGRSYRIGYGAFGQNAHGLIREDLASYDKFHVESASDSARTILTVYIPEKAMISGYRLTIHGPKSHKLYDLTEKDVVDRPSPGIVRYEWKREPAQGPGGVFHAYMKQNSGHFRLYLRTPLVTAVDYFSVPKFERE